MTDNRDRITPGTDADLRKSNQVADHVHHYVPKGSGLSCWAECIAIVEVLDGPHVLPCGHKLAGDNGPIVGSRSKIERAIREAA